MWPLGIANFERWSLGRKVWAPLYVVAFPRTTCICTYLPKSCFATRVLLTPSSLLRLLTHSCALRRTLRSRLSIASWIVVPTYHAYI